jgi:pyruvate formate lyase activating enzyme
MKKAILWDKTADGKARCSLCAHRCVISEGNFGFCGMRQLKKGELFTYAYGKVAAKNLDPIEKKPLYHYLPGTTTYSVAASGCNFTCSFCQNWEISTLSALKGDILGEEAGAEKIVDEALKSGAASVSYTYTEPTIFFEYALEISQKAKKNGLGNVFVTNGYMTAEAVDEISPFLDAANVDLKFFNDETYRKICGASLKPVLDTIVKMKSSGIWVEVTTLIIPGENDSEKELRDIAGFLSEVDAEMPWHISAFHPDHRMQNVPPTSSLKLEKVKNMASEMGLKHVYTGNLPGEVNTFCPVCGTMLIRRFGYETTVIDENFHDGKCLICGESVRGRWKIGSYGEAE